jgi:hypothetical protein
MTVGTANDTHHCLPGRYTMPENGRADLRVDPVEIRGLIQSYEFAATEVQDIVERVRQHGRLDEVWSFDEVSRNVADHYNYEVIDSPTSTHAALLRYQQELAAAITALKQMLADYERVEADAVAAFSRR